MKNITAIFIVSVVMLSIANQQVFALDSELQQIITKDTFMPKGHYYEANVPDTFDIAERAELAVYGLTSFLNDKKDYQPYQHGFLNVEKPYYTNVFGGAVNWNCGKIMESLIMMRLISGSSLNLDIQEKSIKDMLPLCLENGSAPTARMMMALMDLYQQSPNEKLLAAIEALKNSFPANAKYDGDKAYFYEGSFEGNESKIGIVGNWGQVFIQGHNMRALSRWCALKDDKPILDFLSKNKNYIMKADIWQPESAPKAVVGSDHGQFLGHHHSYCSGLLGLLWYADVANDVRAKEFVRESYEYLRTFGIARIGLFGEMCTTGDMTLLAVRLSQTGAGDYWEDVDSYVRNQLAERQVTDTDKLQKATACQPILCRIGPDMPGIQTKADSNLPQKPLDPINETEDNVAQRCKGIYLSDSAQPDHIPKHRLMWVICCSGNCPPALYAAWDSTIQYKDGNAQINLLLNRASEWLDIDSYIPYEGKVVIKNKQAKNINVRIPLYVDKKDLNVTVNDKSISCVWLNRYLCMDNLKRGDVITIKFPLVETVEKYTLKWKDEDFWCESTNPGNKWTAGDKVYTMHFKGNTLVDISPRSEDICYPLYQRDFYKADTAPMKKVKRFIPDTILKW